MFLTLLTGLSTRFTFNLAFGLLGGTILQGAFSLARNWGGTGSAPASRARRSTLLLGNLSGLREWLVAQARARLGLLLGDLARHQGHDQRVPALEPALRRPARARPRDPDLPALRRGGAPPRARSTATRRRGRATAARRRGAARLPRRGAGADERLGRSAAVGPPRCSSALTASAVPGARRSQGLGRAARGASAVAAASAFVARAAALGPRRRRRRDRAEPRGLGAPGVDQLDGLRSLLLPRARWWLAAAGRLADSGVSRAGARGPRRAGGGACSGVLAVRRPDAFLRRGVVLFLGRLLRPRRDAAEDRLAFGFVATAFFLVLFCQRLYIYDRMNTFFKLYLEAGCSSRSRRRSSSSGRASAAGRSTGWAFPARAAGRGARRGRALHDRDGAGAPPVSRPLRARTPGPSLDGLRYLETLHPGEYRAVVWMRRTIEGTPVVLEAQGPSYQDFGRDLDAHRAADGARLGLPRQAARQPGDRDRGAPAARSRRSTRPRIVARVEPLLRRYRVGYVYVGWLERKTYPAAGPPEVRGRQGLFQLVYENPEAQIYRVAGGPRRT